MNGVSGASSRDFATVEKRQGDVWIIWNDEPGENVEHISEHGLLPEDIESVLANHAVVGTSQSSGRPCVFGHTEDGRYIIVLYDQIDSETIYPVTAFEVPEP